MDRDGRARQRTAEARLADLPRAIRDGHRVVFGHHSLGLDCENPVEIRAARPAKRRAFFPENATVNCALKRAIY